MLCRTLVDAVKHWRLRERQSLFLYRSSPPLDANSADSSGQQCTRVDCTTSPSSLPPSAPRVTAGGLFKRSLANTVRRLRHSSTLRLCCGMQITQHTVWSRYGNVSRSLHQRPAVQRKHYVAMPVLNSHRLGVSSANRSGLDQRLASA